MTERPIFGIAILCLLFGSISYISIDVVAPNGTLNVPGGSTKTISLGNLKEGSTVTYSWSTNDDTQDLTFSIESASGNSYKRATGIATGSDSFNVPSDDTYSLSWTYNTGWGSLATSTVTYDYSVQEPSVLSTLGSNAAAIGAVIMIIVVVVIVLIIIAVLVKAIRKQKPAQLQYFPSQPMVPPPQPPYQYQAPPIPLQQYIPPPQPPQVPPQQQPPYQPPPQQYVPPPVPPQAPPPQQPMAQPYQQMAYQSPPTQYPQQPQQAPYPPQQPPSYQQSQSLQYSQQPQQYPQQTPPQKPSS